jgi:hypothetical protein
MNKVNPAGVSEMRTGVAAAFILCFFWGRALPAAAPPAVAAAATAHTKLRLVSNAVTLEPGRQLDLGLLFDLGPHWHIYWSNPGDSGEPPVVRWRLPEGFRAACAGECEGERKQSRFSEAPTRQITENKCANRGQSVMLLINRDFTVRREDERLMSGIVRSTSASPAMASHADCPRMSR